jgi:hypothetical protein
MSEPNNGQTPVVAQFNRPKPRQLSPHPNPIADDGLIEAPVPRRPGRPRKSTPVEEIPRPADIQALLEMLGNLPDILPQASYADCGHLINALSRATTDTVLARRQKQEQLEAGSQMAHCTTCGSKIDISKSGTFQMLTERDEFFQPINRFYCSANCVIAKNLPSLAKEREKARKKAERV